MRTASKGTDGVSDAPRRGSLVDSVGRSRWVKTEANFAMQRGTCACHARSNGSSAGVFRFLESGRLRIESLAKLTALILLVG